MNPDPHLPASNPELEPQTRKARWKAWLRDALIFLVVLLALTLWQTRNVPGGKAPDFTALQPNGEVLSLEQWRARYPQQPVALYFWAEWCGVCRANEGMTDSVVHAHPVLTVAMQSGSADAVARYLADRGLDWPVVVDAEGEIARAYGFRAVPAYVVIDRSGEIRHAALGFTTAWGMRLRLWLAKWD